MIPQPFFLALQFQFVQQIYNGVLFLLILCVIITDNVLLNMQFIAAIDVHFFQQKDGKKAKVDDKDSKVIVDFDSQERWFVIFLLTSHNLSCLYVAI